MLKASHVVKIQFRPAAVDINPLETLAYIFCLCKFTEHQTNNNKLFSSDLVPPHLTGQPKSGRGREAVYLCALLSKCALS